MTGLIVLAGMGLALWLWMRQKQWKIKRLCGRGHHSFVYSGEMHDKPKWRTCLMCDYTEATAPNGQEHESVNPLVVNAPPGETVLVDADGRDRAVDFTVYGKWGYPRMDAFTVRQMSKGA